uniref:Protein phosphatase 1 regulatory inhibitor subunit 1C n=1 Tax=Strix occidentalis caurina TaxID=311401 RepID=A0A8D0FUK3_STROC
MEPNSPKKIQFAVPLFQSQIDPEAAEQIRKRRPTPASLVIMNEHVPPGKLQHTLSHKYDFKRLFNKLFREYYKQKNSTKMDYRKNSSRHNPFETHYLLYIKFFFCSALQNFFAALSLHCPNLFLKEVQAFSH